MEKFKRWLVRMNHRCINPMFIHNYQHSDLNEVDGHSPPHPRSEVEMGRESDARIADKA